MLPKYCVFISPCTTLLLYDERNKKIGLFLKQTYIESKFSTDFKYVSLKFGKISLFSISANFHNFLFLFLKYSKNWQILLKIALLSLPSVHNDLLKAQLSHMILSAIFLAQCHFVLKQKNQC